MITLPTSVMYLGETKTVYITHTRDGVLHTLEDSVITVSVLQSIDDETPVFSKTTTLGQVDIATDFMSALAVILPSDTVSRGHFILQVEIVWMTGLVVTERYVGKSELIVN